MRIAVALAAVAVLFGVAIVALASTRTSASAGRCGIRGKPPPSTIGVIQGLQFKLMKKSSFNAFDGPKVVRDLLHNRRLWCGVVMDRGGNDFLIKLRDVADDAWNVDTLYILSSRANDQALRRLAQHWNADEVRWLSGTQANTLLGESGSKPNRILEAWWD